jgi:predicted MPP superfamily phosphohydrolase
VRLFQPFVAGLHRLEEMWLYVSRGTGYWGPPLRLGAPAEITVIELRASGSTAADIREVLREVATAT